MPTSSPEYRITDTALSQQPRRPQQFGPSAKMTTVMDPELKRRLKDYCAVTQQSAASVLDRLIRSELAQWER